MASKSKSFLNTIKKTVIGTTFDDLLGVNKSLKRLSRVSVAKDAATFSELLKTIAPKNQKTKQADYEALLKDLGVSQPIGIESDRAGRYATYRAMVMKVSYLKRALEVVTQNILAPDDISKVSLSIIPDENLTSEQQTLVKHEVNRLVEDFEIEHKLYEIVYNTLMKGDYFVEVVPTNEILESNNIKLEGAKLKTKDRTVKFQVYMRKAKKKKLSENEDGKPSKNAKHISQNDLFLNMINPETVVRVGDKFCLGYFVFPKQSGNMQSQVANVSFGQADNVVDRLLSRIKGLTNTGKLISNNEMQTAKTDLREIIVKLLLMGNDKQGLIQARYIPPDRMVHFVSSKGDFKPYGTSMFYGMEFITKIIVAQQSTLMVQRIMNSMERRVIKVELGITRDAKRYLQEFKEALRRKKFTVDNIGNIDEIPSNISTFEDIYIPTMNGRDLVSIDTVPPRGDIGTHVEDLKHMRDVLVAGLNVPPAYLGLEENIESKATLSQENVLFASSVVNYQKELGKYLTDLMRKLIKFTSKTIDPKSFRVEFNQPKNILIQAKLEYITSVVDIIEKLTSLGLPKEYLIKKYLPEIDLDEIKQEQISDKINNALGSNKSEQPKTY